MPPDSYRVNVSLPASFQDRPLLPTVKTLLKDAVIDPSWLEFG